MKVTVLGDRHSWCVLSSYRGTHRMHPLYCTELGEEHEANRALLDYFAESGEDGFTANVELARRLVKAYAELDPPQHYDIIEATTCNRSARSGQQLLGFDVCYLGVSLSILTVANIFSDSEPGAEQQSEVKLEYIDPLLRLMRLYFKPALNENGLFGERETAEFCLECAKAMDHFYPGLWEDSNTIKGLQVVAIYLVL